MRIIIVLLLLSVSSEEKALLKAHYESVKGSNPEYGQGAIERNDLPHREIERFTWLIEVAAPAEPAEWQRRLNAAVDPQHGSFRVERASAEEERRVRSGEMTLQR